MEGGQQQIACTYRPRLARRTEWWRTFGILCLFFLAAAIALPAQTGTTTFTTLHRFDGTDGGYPTGPLVQATDGNLYGTTTFGGASTNCRGGCGTVFKISPIGTLTMLYSFCAQSGCPDGSSPVAGLIQATDGNFYGTTSSGGSNFGGTVFKMTPGSTLATLYSFCVQSGCPDGSSPYALVQATDGNFYGTTISGGSNFGGTVFKMTPGGTLTTLYSFCSQVNCTDGVYPGELVQATDGNFYGTTADDGANGQGGTVFKITPNGTLTTLYSFCAQINCTDGDSPQAALVQGTDGNFYGTTQYGYGANGNYGKVFKITRSGTLTTLYSFCSQSGCTDGRSPTAGLVQASDGDFYGTTPGGGANGNYGTVFKITQSGTLTTLYSFCSQSGCSDGEAPFTGLVQATSGKFYGTTAYGGDSGDGTVFSLSLGLAPFVETLPNLGKVGVGVRILGTNLTGASGVTFNGTPAAFTVRSGTFITTTVPAGATTGYVEVVTPGGTLSSNVKFRVR